MPQRPRVLSAAVAGRSRLRASLRSARVTARALREHGPLYLDNVRLRSQLAAHDRAERAERADRLGYLFVVSYGRSGSTLLQGLLNSTPGYLIRGENDEAMFHLYNYHRVLTSAYGKYGGRTPLPTTDSWYGIENWDRERSLEATRRLVLRTLLQPQADTRVVGFKEIRWWHKDSVPYVQFLQDLFPGARFVINTRDHAAVAKSKWWRDVPDMEAKLARYEGILDDIEAALGPAAHRVHFDDYVADPGRLAPMFEWLGEPFDRARIDAILSVKHSS